jgi:hypothetical protein
MKGSSMLGFNLKQQQEWNSKHHVEKILGEIGDGDVTVACWEPQQISSYHCHPEAVEIYLCFSGGGFEEIRLMLASDTRHQAA